MTSPPAVITWAGGEDGAVVEVTATGAAAEAVHRAVPALLADQVASRLAGQDPTLWGDHRAEYATDRLGWTSLHETSRPLVDQVTTLRAELQRVMGRGPTPDRLTFLTLPQSEVLLRRLPFPAAVEQNLRHLVGAERAPHAGTLRVRSTFLRVRGDVRRVEGAVDDQLTATLKEVEKAHRTLRAVEAVLLRQSNRLRSSRPEDLGCFHRPTSA